jgi:hypothetical protein
VAFVEQLVHVSFAWSARLRRASQPRSADVLGVERIVGFVLYGGVLECTDRRRELEPVDLSTRARVGAQVRETVFLHVP